MTKALQKMLKKAATWPQEVQDEAAGALQVIEMAYQGTYEFTPEDLRALERSAEDVRLKRFVPMKKVRRFFKTGRA